MRFKTALIALVLLCATVIAYYPGLNGPFLFDDPSNIILPMQAWLNGKTDWPEFILGNRSGTLGRTVSMLSFALNGATTGLDVLPFKATNLAVHLLCGIVLYLLLMRLLARDQSIAPKARLTATLITAIWLLHPIQVSTVLYVVQRMAQLSTLFMLLAMYAYVAGREYLEKGQLRRANFHLFVTVPASTIVAVLSKENGLLVPLLCAVIELAYFRPNNNEKSPALGIMPMRAFFTIFLALPALGAAALLAIKPAIFFGGYDGRLFTLGERLLSQPRALVDYIGVLLLPQGPSLGVYTDDFLVSHNLFDPPSTFWSIAALLGLIFFSVAFRKSAPTFFAGTWLFLCGHVMESTVFPLEMYFEHRNYLPSIGLFLAIAGLLSYAIPFLQAKTSTRRLGKLLLGGATLLIILLGSATAIRSSIWSTWAGIAEQGVQQHPSSRRAHMDKISILLAQGQTEEAREILLKMLSFSDPSARGAATLTIAWLDCRKNGRIEPEEVERIASLAGEKLQLSELFASEKLGGLLIEKDCDGLSKERLAYLLRDITSSSGQKEGLTPVWRLRFMASRLFAESGLLPLAIEQAALAWMTGKADPAVGVHLINLYFANGDPKSAELLLIPVMKKIPDWDTRNKTQIKKVLEHYRSTMPSAVERHAPSVLPP